MYLKQQPDPAIYSLPPAQHMTLGWALELQQRNQSALFPQFHGLWGDRVGKTFEYGVQQAQPQFSKWAQPYRGPSVVAPRHDAPRQMVSPSNPPTEHVQYRAAGSCCSSKSYVPRKRVKK